MFPRTLLVALFCLRTLYRSATYTYTLNIVLTHTHKSVSFVLSNVKQTIDETEKSMIAYIRYQCIQSNYVEWFFMRTYRIYVK